MPGIKPFALAPREAINFLRRRLAMTDEEWQAFHAIAGQAANILALDQKDQMARDFIEAALKALENGDTATEFFENYENITAQYGWSYDGEARWHSNLIFKTQINIAQAAGRWEQIERVKSTRPYLRYVTAGDHRVRHVHAGWHNIVLPVDHPWWKTHYPPNGFGCRCFVQSLNERDLDRFNYKITEDSNSALAVPPDKGWFGNVGIDGLLLS